MSKEISKLIRTKEHTYNEVQVTPEIAVQLLQNNYGHNRPLKASVVKRYANMMRTDEWNARAADPIKVSVDGMLLNGQHRMNAVIISGETIPMTIETGLEVGDYKSIDQGSTRTGADIIGEEKNRYAKAAGIKAIINFNKGKEGQKIFHDLVTNKEVGDWLEDEGLDSLDHVNFNVWKKSLNVPPSVYYLFSSQAQSIDPQAFDAFTTMLCEGVGLTSSHPILKMRNYLLSPLRPKRRNETEMTKMYQLLVKTWNTWRQGKTIKGQLRVPNKWTLPE